MKWLLIAALLGNSSCIAAGAVTGAVIGTLAPIGIAANADDPAKRTAAPSTIIISTLVCAGIGTLIGLLAVEDNKPKKEESTDDESADPETD